MRVLLISHTCQSRAEGQRKAERLSRFGDIELKVVVPRRFNHYGHWQTAETPETDSFEYEAIKAAWTWLGPARNYLHWYPDLARVIRQFQPDIIDLWEEPWSLASAQACWLRNRLVPDAKVIMESEQNLLKKFPPPFCWIESYTFRNADFAIGRSTEVIRVLRSKGYDGAVRTVGNAVDTDLFRPMDREACKRELGLMGFTVGYVGRLVERKGLRDMIDALPYCPEETTMIFAGGGEYREELEKQVAKIGRSSQVRFLEARRLEQLPVVMNALDALILPSWTARTWKEQFGRVIIEAHACRTPVAGSDSGAIPEVVGEGGLIYSERHPKALAEAIWRFREYPKVAREMGEAGRKQVKASFTWEKIADEMHEVYLACMRSQRGASETGRLRPQYS